MYIFKMLIYMILSIIAIYFIFNTIYLIYFYIKNKNDKTKLNAIINKINKSKNINKLNYYLFELKKINNKKYKFFSNTLIIIISLIFSIAIFFITYHIFDILSTAILLSLISFCVPYFVIEQLYKIHREQIVDNFPMYILTLKNYVHSTNDIILAFRKANVPDYLATYINKFNISIEKGISIVQAFEQLKKDINISVISDFLSSLLTCHLNGGNVCILLNKYAEMLTKINIKKAEQTRENLSNIIVFFVLVIINFFLLFSFVYSNTEYKHLMTTNLIGKIIINCNVISYLIIFLLYRNISKKV